MVLNANMLNDQKKLKRSKRKKNLNGKNAKKTFKWSKSKEVLANSS